MSNRRTRRWNERRLGALIFFCAFTAAYPAPGAATMQDLRAAFERNQWDEAAQLAFEILKREPSSGTAKIQGAYALFQRGFTNSALMLLKKLTPEDWASLPQGQDRFVEIVALFQKKVPLSVLPGRLERASIDKSSAYLRDEIRFAKGRAALAARNVAEASAHFAAVSRSSRFYPQARYSLAAIAVRQGNSERAEAELSRVFEPTILSQTSEFWKDMSSQVTSHWGSSIRVYLDTEPLLKGKAVGELALLGFARLAYARKSFDAAIAQYEKLSSESRHSARAALEKTWALLQLNRHDDAQKAAAQLASGEDSFEAIEASPLRALILTDNKKIAEARDELFRFFSTYEKSRDALNRYLKYQTAGSLPDFIKEDIKREEPLQQHRQYQADVQREIEALNRQDARLFPQYRLIALELDPLLGQSQKEIARLTAEIVRRRLADLDRLAIQAKLIRAETFLEEREALRGAYRDLKDAGADKQREHDQKLVELLTAAVTEVDEAIALGKKRQPNLEFRQAELLWELATARAILAQAEGKKSALEESDKLKARALAIAEGVAGSFPDFAKRADTLFFTGFAQLELGKEAAGEATLQRYVQTYPRHYHAPDAYRILADARFDRNDFAGALSYYRQVLSTQDSPIIGYALYKLGWCAYNLKNYPQAILGLEKAIQWAQSQKDADGTLNLTREAKRDLVSIYAEVGDHRKAWAYFRMVFGDEARPFLVEYAKELDRNGQFEKSTEIYKSLIADKPSAEENIEFQTAIIRGNYRLRRWPDVEAQTVELTDRFRKELAEPAAEGTRAALAEQITRETSLAQHFEFKRSASKEDVERIARFDRAYLAAFGRWPASQEVRYEFAHFLLENKKRAEAAAEFKAHWTQFKGTLKDPLREEALRNLLYALEKVETANKVELAPDSLTAVKRSETADDIVTFSNEYNAEYRLNKYSRPIAALRSVIHFKYNELDLGMTESQRLLDESASDEAGKAAFRNLRLAYYRKKDWKAANEWATRMTGRSEMASYRAELRTMRGETAFLYAESPELDQESAAKELLRIAENPDFEWLREKALYNAFVRLEKAGRKAEAVAISAKLAKASPGFSGLKEVAGVRAALYQEAGDYERALPLLRDFLQHPDKDVSPEVLQQARLNAALIAEATGQLSVAVSLFREYLNQTSGKETAGALEAKNGIRRIETRGQRDVASVPEGWDALDRARREFESTPLPRKPKDLAGRIKSGGAALESLARRFLQVATRPETPRRFAFEAYCSVPFLYVAYARGLDNLGKKGPAEVTAELKKIAEPLDARAAELGRECVKRSQEAEHVGALYRRALDRWGWPDSATAQRVKKLTALLERGAPWLEPSPSGLDEPAVLELHLAGQGTPDTWYQLARLRFISGRRGLARLTAIDSMGKSPDTARLLHLTALIDSAENEGRAAAAALQQAAERGSGPAAVNLALYHLRGCRVSAASGALRLALEKKVFDGNEELMRLAKEVATP